MLQLLAWIGRHAMVALVVSVFVGLALPGLAAMARPLLPATVVVLLAVTLLRLDWEAIGRELRRPGRHLLLLLWLQLALPLLVWAALAPGWLPESLAMALVLMAAAPAIVSAAALANLLGLDGPFALVAAVAGTVVTPFLLPPLVLSLLGLELEIALGPFMLRLALLVGLAFAIAFGLRRLLGPARLAAGRLMLDGAMVLAMLVFAVAIMDGVTARALERPDIALVWLVAAWLANPLLQFLGALAWRPLGRRAALTAGLVTGNRNMGLLVAALPGGVPYDVVLFFGIAQIPMYVLPALLRPAYRRLLAR